jgi:hypothetical protein
LSHSLDHPHGRGCVVIHDVMLSLFRISRMLSQPSHGGAPAIEVSVLGIDFHAAKFRLVIEPFAAETYAFYHVLIVTHYRQLSINIIL